MKRIFFLLCLIAIINSMSAQDLVVTSDGDSINCKITKVEKHHIYFTFKYNEEIRNTLFAIADIKNYQYNFYSTNEVPGGMVLKNKDYSRIRFGIQGGYSYLTAPVSESVPPDFRDYIRKLKSGFHVGLDFTYYFTEMIGIGIKSSIFNSSNSMDNIYVVDFNGIMVYGKMKDNIINLFLGPDFSLRILGKNKKNSAFVFHFSLGYMRYHIDKILITPYKLTGNTIGMSCDIGYDIVLSKNIALGLQVSGMLGALSKYTISNGIQSQVVHFNKGEYESLNRLDFSIGLRFVL